MANCMDHCENELSLHKLCAKRARIDHLEVCKLELDSVCAQKVEGVQVSADSFNSNNFCSQNGTFNNLCVTNLNAVNFDPVVKYRATVNYSANTTYTLGNFLNFDNIVDDPNNNVSLSPNTSYTAPISGYYMMTFKVNVTNLVPSSGPILGVPVANPEVYVNGLLVREGFSPFLTFFNTQKVILNSLITLQAGDVVTMKYNVLAGSGLPVAGTVDIVGAGIEDGNSLFKIILLSGLTAPAQCVMCTPVVISCADDNDDDCCKPCTKPNPAPAPMPAPTAPVSSRASRS